MSFEKEDNVIVFYNTSNGITNPMSFSHYLFKYFKGMYDLKRKVNIRRRRHKYPLTVFKNGLTH